MEKERDRERIFRTANALTFNEFSATLMHAFEGGGGGLPGTASAANQVFLPAVLLIIKSGS